MARFAEPCCPLSILLTRLGEPVHLASRPLHHHIHDPSGHDLPFEHLPADHILNLGLGFDREHFTDLGKQFWHVG